MHSRTRNYLIAGMFAGLPVIALGIFMGWLILDMRSVESSTLECEELLPTIAEFKMANGRYPTETEADQISPRLRTYCHYQTSGNSFVLVRTGAHFNLQAYVFSPDAGEWYWD